MKESQRNQTDERNLGVNSSPPADHSTEQSPTADQTPPSVGQSTAAPQGTATSVETKDNGNVAVLEHRATEKGPAVAEDSDTGGQLFATDDKSSFRARWDSIQTRFVDEPKQAVKEADMLVIEVTDRLTRTFAAERDALEKQWTDNTEASTEDLRQAFQKYRSFFDRLLVA